MNHLKIFLLSLVVLSGSLAECDSSFHNDDSDIVNERGILKTAGQGYIIEAASPPKTRENASSPFSFFPLNLPDNFQKDGLQVIFSANIEECGGRATCIALPVTLTKIKRR